MGRILDQVSKKGKEIEILISSRQLLCLTQLEKEPGNTQVSIVSSCPLTRIFMVMKDQEQL